MQWARVRSLVGSISWLRFIPGLSLNSKTNVRKLGHIHPRLSYGHSISSKPYIIHLQMETVSEHSLRTWPSLNYKQQWQQQSNMFSFGWGSVFCGGGVFCRGNVFCRGYVFCRGNAFCRGGVFCIGDVFCRSNVFCIGDVFC